MLGVVPLGFGLVKLGTCRDLRIDGRFRLSKLRLLARSGQAVGRWMVKGLI